jgi:hypothetical protein
MTIIQNNPFSEDQLADLAASDAEVGLPDGFSAKQIMRESGNNPHAVSPAGAVGYAQVMPKTLATLNQRLGRTLDPSNWTDALLIQKTLMKENMSHFGNVADATAAYNGGWDRSRWNNSETQSYVAALTGGAPGAAPRQAGDPNADQPDNVYVPHFKQPNAASQMTAIDKEFALRAGGKAAAEANATASNGADQARPDLDTSLYPKIGEESADAVARETQHAGMGETFLDGFKWNTITGRLLDHASQDQMDPNYKWTTDKVGAFAQAHPEIYANDEMRDYVLGSQSEGQTAQRTTEAMNHLDFQRRYANTSGLAGAGDFLMMQLGAMADPVTLAATIGVGAGVNAVRGGVEAALMTRMAYATAEGAATNIALGKAISDMDNQEFGWKDVVGQGVAGAALGALAGLIPHKTKLEKADPGVKLDGIDHLADGAERTASDVINNITEKEKVDSKGLDGRDAGSIDPHADPKEKIVTNDEPKHPNEIQEKIDAVKDEEIREKEAELQAKEDEKNPPTDDQLKDREDAEVAKDVLDGTETKVKEEEKVIDWAVNGGDRNRVISGAWLKGEARKAYMAGETKPTTAREALAEVAKHGDEHEQALAGRLSEAITDSGAKVYWHEGNGRAFYEPNRHEVHMFKDGLKSDVGSQHRIVLHEIAHSVSQMKLSYGKRHPDTVHGKLFKQFDTLRQSALREFNKRLKQEDGTKRTALTKGEHETAYYLKNADEFLAGLFSNQADFLNHLRSIKPAKGIGDLLSKTVDVLRSIIGLKPGEASYLTQAMGLADKVLDSRIKTTFRYSDGASMEVLGRAVGGRHDIPLGPLASQVEGQLKALADRPAPVETTKMRENHERWYKNWRGKTGLGKALGTLDSVGLRLGLSDNKMVRAVANMLCEDATGGNRLGGTSAAIDKAMLAANWRTPLVNAWKELYPQLMTAREKAEALAGGGNEAFKRIGKQVQEERLKHRQARAAGTEYVSQAHPAIVKLAAAMDGMFKGITEHGVKAGEEATTKISKSGWQGYMPYRFDDSALRQLYRDAATNPERAAEWNHLISNFRTQYVEKLTEPMRKKMSNAGPADAREVLKRVTEMANKRTDDYFTQIMRQQGDRVLGADDHFANVAASMLEDVKALRGNKATRLTNDLIKQFRKDLADVVNDRSRTEFNLLHEVNGVRMLDYMDTDFGRMVDQNTSHYAGAVALARRGIKDEAHWTATKDVLAKHGATDEELVDMEFVRKSLMDLHNINDNAAASALQSATALAMMGKVGLNALGDAGALVGAVGVGGFLKAFGKSFGKQTELVKQLNIMATSALGLDHRLKFHETSSGVQPHAGSMISHPIYRNTVHGLGTALQWMSLSRPVQIATHRAAVPAITEELIRAIRGTAFDEAGNIIRTGSDTLNPARLVETGLDAERVRNIKELLETHDGARKEGEIINWSKWDKDRPGYAEDFIGSIHRVTGQVLQRAFIGEQPRWQVETQMGRFFTQFRNAGMVGSEKQFGRNMSHADRTTVMQFGFNAVWATALYWAKTMASSAGMDDVKRDEYLKKRFHGLDLASGVAAMTNVSGIGSDTLDAVNMMFGGQSNGSSPFASMGYLKNVGTAFARTGGALTGAENSDAHKASTAVFKTLPLSNTFLGTALVNGMAAE